MIGAITEKRFEYKGFPCVVLMQGWAYRTGYVGIPIGHKLFRKFFGDININCHGGLTYSSSRLIGQDDKDTWWIGFDCNHLWDAKDYESALELFKNYPDNVAMIKRSQEQEINEPGSEVCSLEYCENQCKEIVKQILEI